MSARWPELVLPRSLLYVPGHRSDLVAKGSRSAADAVVVDLEDSVPSADKAQAREVVRQWLAEPSVGPQRWVRINSGVLDEDLAVLEPHLPDGVLVAGCRAAGLDRLESWWTRESRPDRPVVGLVEDAAGLREIDAMAQAPHLATVGIVGCQHLVDDGYLGRVDGGPRPETEVDKGSRRRTERIEITEVRRGRGHRCQEIGCGRFHHDLEPPRVDHRAGASADPQVRQQVDLAVVRGARETLARAKA